VIFATNLQPNFDSKKSSTILLTIANLSNCTSSGHIYLNAINHDVMTSFGISEFGTRYKIMERIENLRQYTKPKNFKATNAQVQPHETNVTNQRQNEVFQIDDKIERGDPKGVRSESPKPRRMHEVIKEQKQNIMPNRTHDHKPDLVDKERKTEALRRHARPKRDPKKKRAKPGSPSTLRRFAANTRIKKFNSYSGARHRNKGGHSRTGRRKGIPNFDKKSESREQKQQGRRHEHSNPMKKAKFSTLTKRSHRDRPTLPTEFRAFSPLPIAKPRRRAERISFEKLHMTKTIGRGMKKALSGKKSPKNSLI
jgi:hypothetical protein